MFVLLCMILTFAHAETPAGWFVAGSDPGSYSAEVVSEAHTGSQAARLRHSAAQGSAGFGTMMQNMSPAEYAGSRVRMTAWLKSEDVEHWAGLWLRVDGKQGVTLSFDNMSERPVRGTTPWKKYEVVLDVPNDAVNMGFGVLITGKGTVWLDDLTFEQVGTDVPITSRTKPAKPVNPSFER